MEVVWSTPLVGNVDDRYAIVFPIFLHKNETVIAVVHTIGSTYFITCNGALPNDKIGDTQMAEVLKTPETVLDFVRGIFSPYVILTFDELSKLSVQISEAKDVVYNVNQNTAFRGVYKSNQERSDVVRIRHEHQVMGSLSMEEIPSEYTSDSLECGRGHVYSLDERIHIAKKEGLKYITCGNDTCTQRVFFSTLYSINLSPSSFAALIGL
jgi:hypothetical protein